MKENYIGKMKTLLVAMLMIVSVVAVFQMTETVKAGASNAIQGSITDILVTGLAEKGQYVSGAVNISWTSTVKGNFDMPTYYNVTFTRQQAPGTDGLWASRDRNPGGNRSWENGNATAYQWNTTNVPDGVWFVNVTATIWNGTEVHWVNGSSIQINVSNNYSGVPGVDTFQGGNATVGQQPLSVNKNDIEVGTASTTLTLNSGAGWTSGLTYYLYYPIYLGSERESDPYKIHWRRYGTTAVPTDGSAFTLTDGFNISGIWVIDARDGLAAYDHSDADFSNISNANKTVPAWFWVNTSTNYTMTVTGITNDWFYYNSSGELTINIFDENSAQPTSGSIDPIVDIRRDSNKTSINKQNKRLHGWVTTGDSIYYKNNSYGGSNADNAAAFPGETGFWEAGNYTISAYIDTDNWISGSDNGLQDYTQRNMDNGAHGWLHYNETYGSNSNRNGSATGWADTHKDLNTATRYNYRLSGPWDPPEYNVTQQYIRVKTREPYAQVSENSTVYYGFDGTVNITLAESQGGVAIDPTKINITILDDDDVNVTGNFTQWISTGTGGVGLMKRELDLEPPGLVDCGGRVTIYKTGADAGWILVNMTKWGRNATRDERGFADNGTWEIRIWSDMGSDRDRNGVYKEWTEEWNTSITWKVASAPSAQWRWVDDDGAVWSNADTDEIIPYVPNASNVPLDITFKIFDSGGNTFGDLTSGMSSGMCESIMQCAANITISGNTLFTGKLSSFPGFYGQTSPWYQSGVWHVPIIPTMNVGGGSSVTIQVNAYNSSVSRTIAIGGDDYDQNGSVVSVTPSEFSINEDQNLSVSVKYADDGSDMRSATCTLYYIDDSHDGNTDLANGKVCKPIVGHDIAVTGAYSGGVYTISFNTTQQTYNQTTGEAAHHTSDGAGFAAYQAPRNLTVFVDGPGHRDGYVLIQMNAISGLEVFIEEQSEFTMMSALEYDDFAISCNFVGNSTETPDVDDKATFQIKIVDEHGVDVTGTSNTDALLYNLYKSRLTDDNDYIFEQDNVYGLDAGTYEVYAWNNTHNSKGHNATLIIKAVDVTCDMAPFIFMVDTNISATFTIKYDGEPVEGTLILDNVSDQGAYNRTWMNTSFDGSSDASTCDGTPGGPCNSTFEISNSQIVDGVVTVHDITVNKLLPGKAKQYITFFWRPRQTDGSDASKFGRASARMNVEVPTITPDPMYIPLGRTTKVYCTATGRGETLSDVYVRLHGQGFDQNGETDVDGRVAFSITPASTGNISIDAGAKNRTLADTVVYVVAWVIDGSTDAAEVNEGDDFTVTVVKEGTTDAVVGADVTIVGIGSGVTDANGQATFTAPEVTSDRTYTIKITKEGYAPDPDGLTITVINIPRLTIVLPDSVQATTTFEVAVADDTGGAIVGAIITFNEKTYTTGVNGIATLTAPKTKGDYPIKATFGTYVEATGTVTVTAAPGIPGFELLSLIAALGVAFILLRRRRK